MAKKLESSFTNMVVVLFAVTLIASAAVGYVNQLTSAPIAEAKKAKQIDAIKQVIPGSFDNNPSEDMYSVKTDDGETLEFFPATKGGELVGTAVKSYTNNGFSGKIWIMVGFTPKGEVTNYSVLEHKETPGLGSKMDVWFVEDGKGDIIGMNPTEKPLQVSKDGGSVDAITAATITSRAFLDAVNRAAETLAAKNK